MSKDLSKLNPFDYPKYNMNSVWTKVNFKGWKCWGELPDEYLYTLDDDYLNGDLCHLTNGDYLIDIRWDDRLGFECIVATSSYSNLLEELKTKDPSMVWLWIHHMSDKYRG